jgi:hypothetical protein
MQNIKNLPPAVRYSILFVLGLLLITTDQFLNEGAYSKISYLGFFILSVSSILLLVNLLSDKNAEIFLIGKIGLVIILTGAITLIYHQAYLLLFNLMLPEIVIFACAFIIIGLSLFIIKPFTLTNDEIQSITDEGEGDKLIYHIFGKASMVKKIIWGVIVVGAIVITHLAYYKYENEVIRFLFSLS